MSDNGPPIPQAPPPFSGPGRNAAIGDHPNNSVQSTSGPLLTIPPLPKPNTRTQSSGQTGGGFGSNSPNSISTGAQIGTLSRATMFEGAKAGSLFTTPPSQVSSRPNISQLPTPMASAGHGTFSPSSPHPVKSAASTTTSTPVTAAELGVKFVDQGKAEINEENRASWKAFRAKVATEILTTERTYVRELDMMIKAYHDPYMEGKSGTGLTDKKIASLFTLPKVILNVAKSFLAEVEVFMSKWDQDEVIAPVFLKYYAMFRTYRDYAVQHQQTILGILRKITSRSAFPAFQEKQVKTLQCQDLASYLIMPIQRIPRYRMLIESIISKTESTDPQAQLLLNALKNVNEVANSVNEAMRSAQLVQRYMDVQKMFDSNGELVHLWRKLVGEIPCKITRVWTQHVPQREDKPKEKKEKKHKFVGYDATLFVFTDCLFLGIKDASRAQKYEETRNLEQPFPLFSGDYQFKFSLKNLDVHDLLQSKEPYSVTINGEYTYHYNISLCNPLMGISLAFDTHGAKESAIETLNTTCDQFKEKVRADGIFFDAPTNGKANEVLCCDRCSYGLFAGSKEKEQYSYASTTSYIICNKCNGITCQRCIHIDEAREKEILSSLSRKPAGAVAIAPSPGCGHTASLPNKFLSYPLYPSHSSRGPGVLDCTGRVCKHCDKEPPKYVTQNLQPGDSAFSSASVRDANAKRTSAVPLPGISASPGMSASTAQILEAKQRLNSAGTPASPSSLFNNNFDTGLSINTNSVSQVRASHPSLNSSTFSSPMPPESPVSRTAPSLRETIEASRTNVGGTRPPQLPQQLSSSAEVLRSPSSVTPTNSHIEDASRNTPPVSAQPPAFTIPPQGSSTPQITPVQPPAFNPPANNSNQAQSIPAPPALPPPTPSSFVPPPTPTAVSSIPPPPSPTSRNTTIPPPPLDVETRPAAPSGSAPQKPKLSPRSQFRLKQASIAAASTAPPPPPPPPAAEEPVPPPPAPSPLGTPVSIAIPPPSPVNGSTPIPPPTPANGMPPPPPPPPANSELGEAIVPVKKNDFASLMPTVHNPQPQQTVKRTDALAPKQLKAKLSIDDGVAPVLVQPPPTHLPIQHPPTPRANVGPPPTPSAARPSGGFKPPMSGFRAPISKQE